MRFIVSFPSEQNQRSSVGAACTSTRGNPLSPLREEVRHAADRGSHIFLDPERGRQLGQPEPFIDEAMEYRGQEYVKAMNEDPMSDPPHTFPWVDDCPASDEDDRVAMVLPLVTITFPTTRLTARATRAASVSFRIARRLNERCPDTQQCREG